MKTLIIITTLLLSFTANASVSNELGLVFEATSVTVNKDGTYDAVIDGVKCESLELVLENGKLSSESYENVQNCIAK